MAGKRQIFFAGEINFLLLYIYNLKGFSYKQNKRSENYPKIGKKSIFCWFIFWPRYLVYKNTKVC